jgi:GNAT superfamily N-acetyltransferase
VSATDRAGFFVREATADDAGELARLRFEHCLELYGRDPNTALTREQFQDVFEPFLVDAAVSGLWRVWIAVADEHPVGTVSLERVTAVPTPWDSERAWGYVTNLQVDVAWRGRGVGRALMVEVQRWAETEGLLVLHLWPSAQSVAFYERVGFRRSGTMEQDVAD